MMNGSAHLMYSACPLVAGQYNIFKTHDKPWVPSARHESAWRISCNPLQVSKKSALALLHRKENAEIYQSYLGFVSLDLKHNYRIECSLAPISERLPVFLSSMIPDRHGNIYIAAGYRDTLSIVFGPFRVDNLLARSRVCLPLSSFAHQCRLDSFYRADLLRISDLT